VSDNRPQYTHKSYDTSREHIIRSVENSLQALHTDFLDLLLIHRPSPLMDPSEIADAFATLRQQGKVRYFGVSNFTPSQFDMLSTYTELVTNQIQASVLYRDPMLDGTLDHSLAMGYRPMAWSPLGSGRIFTDLEAEDVQRVRAVAAELAPKYGDAGLDQLLLAWLQRHPAGILPVLGTARPERVRDAVAAEQIELSRADWFKLWEAAAGEEVP
ncbi:MAG: aldo/keto reductase, partial [Bacteroidota bacterium]